MVVSAASSAVAAISLPGAFEDEDEHDDANTGPVVELPAPELLASPLGDLIDPLAAELLEAVAPTPLPETGISLDEVASPVETPEAAEPDTSDAETTAEEAPAAVESTIEQAVRDLAPSREPMSAQQGSVPTPSEPPRRGQEPAHGGTPEPSPGPEPSPSPSPQPSAAPGPAPSAPLEPVPDLPEDAQPIADAVAPVAEPIRQVAEEVVEPVLALVEDVVMDNLPAPPPLTLPLQQEPRHGANPFSSDPERAPAMDAYPPLEAAVPVPAGTQDAFLIAGSLAMGAGVAGFAAIPGWRRWALRFLGLGPLGFFSRLNQEKLLDHPARNEIHEFVRHNPGERLEVARRSLGLSNGTMLHHVRILIDHNVLRLHRDGAMARLYLAGPRVVASAYLPPLRKRILELLRGTPGVTQRAIANSVGVSERVVSYHVSALKGQGLLAVERAGVANRCFASASVQAV